VKAKLLLVDDEEVLLQQMRCALETEYEVFTSSDETDAIATFAREKPPVVTLDLSLDPSNPSDLAGLRLLEHILTQAPSTKVIIITANHDHANALRAVQSGAFDYFSKPVRLEVLRVMIQRAVHLHEIQAKLMTRPAVSPANFQGIIGGSPRMRDLFRLVERVAASDVSVLIRGESGTGKELVARAIHQKSRRRNGPFVVVNCGAMPENLLESELFGHEKGAFNGAHAKKRGKLDLANTGTLFLDEIGELVPALQVKLLRFLQDRKIERVGGSLPTQLDVRIIAATNRDLERDVENRVFREDLYYRLKVAPLALPALRERKDDILPLAQYFLQRFSHEHRKPLQRLSSAAEDALLSHTWPGNVRELENLISRSVVLNPHPELTPSDLGLAAESVTTDVNLKFAKKAIEIDFVKKALTRNKGVVSRAARDLGISRVNLYELMQKYSICLQDFKLQPLNHDRQRQLNRPEVV
jgi:two-component system, NtrC family, response regulator